MNRYFTTADWVELLRGLPPEGALLHGNSYRVLTKLDAKAVRQACWRLGRKGLLTHIGGGWYTHAFARAGIEEMAPLLVRPSYVSLESALFSAGVTTQPSAALTCVTTRPTQTRRTPFGEIQYHSIARELFFGFELRRSANRQTVLVAYPEKALLDWVYLARKAGDGLWLDLNASRIDRKRLEEFARRFPETVQRAAFGVLETNLATS